MLFSLVPVAGAQDYRAKIATDTELHNIISEVETFGLQGIPQTTAFKLKVRPEPPFSINPKNKSRSENVLFSWTE